MIPAAASKVSSVSQFCLLLPASYYSSLWGLGRSTEMSWGVIGDCGCWTRRYLSTICSFRILAERGDVNQASNLASWQFWMSWESNYDAETATMNGG